MPRMDRHTILLFAILLTVARLPCREKKICNVGKGGDICTRIADSLCCRAETFQHCKATILQ